MKCPRINVRIIIGTAITGDVFIVMAIGGVFMAIVLCMNTPPIVLMPVDATNATIFRTIIANILHRTPTYK